MSWLHKRQPIRQCQLAVFLFLSPRQRLVLSPCPPCSQPLPGSRHQSLPGPPSPLISAFSVPPLQPQSGLSKGNLALRSDPPLPSDMSKIPAGPSPLWPTFPCVLCTSSPGADGQAASGLQSFPLPCPCPHLHSQPSPGASFLLSSAMPPAGHLLWVRSSSRPPLGTSWCGVYPAILVCSANGSLSKKSGSPPYRFLLESLSSVFPVWLLMHSFVQTLSRNFPCVTLRAVSGDKDESTILVLRGGIRNLIGQNDCFVPDTSETSWMSSVMIWQPTLYALSPVNPPDPLNISRREMTSTQGQSYKVPKPALDHSAAGEAF